MTEALTGTATFLDALANALRHAADHNPNAEVPPAAVLWPDGTREWEPIVPRLADLLPVFTLGAYVAADLTGPPAWLRCASAGVLSTISVDGGTPVIYLPGLGIETIRAVANYPVDLQPLAELQYQGRLWRQPDGTDWTLAAFLRRRDAGLGIDVLRGAETEAALRAATIDLIDTPVAQLRASAPLKAIDFRALRPNIASANGTDTRALIASGETLHVELKASARYNVKTKQRDTELHREIWKAVGGMLNSSEGGTVLIGVQDDLTVCGLANDYKVTQKRPDQDMRDVYQRSIMDFLIERFGKLVGSCLNITFDEIDGKDVCRIDVRPARQPMWANEGTTKDPLVVFYVRATGRTDTYNSRETFTHIRGRWPDYKG
jgi:hypothetical protein